LKLKNLRPTSPPSPKKPAPAPAAKPPRAAAAKPPAIDPALEGERLQKVLAAAGLGSRREIEAWIEAGRVSVGGRIAKLGDRATPGEEIAVDGKAVALSKSSQPRVLLYHKPVGELVTRSDPEGRATVFSRLPPGRWVAVGRLDINSAGLLLFTDSGELANRLMHPRYEVEREYAVRVQGLLKREEIEKLTAGIHLEDGVAAFTRIRAMEEKKAAGTNRWYRVALREGRNREVRRLFEAVGARVSRLIRVRYGSVELPRDLDPGRWRELDSTALQGLLKT
jgi:23S rRNA pseudouridine2605 synthase